MVKCPYCHKELDLETIEKLKRKEKLLEMIYEDLAKGNIPIIPCFGDMETTDACETCDVEDECVRYANMTYELRHSIPIEMSLMS